MTDKYEQLTQVVQQANLGIIELKFGCVTSLDIYIVKNQMKMSGTSLTLKRM